MAIKNVDRKLLWGRSGNRCAFPGCQQELTVDLNDDRRTRTALVLGEEAHIVAREDDGPRGDPAVPLADRNAYGNLVLLCPTHHTLIDKDHGRHFTVDDLLAMKRTHEADIERWRATRSPAAEPARSDTDTPVGIPVRDADPFGLEIHEAISLGEGSDGEPLPAYFRRPFDDELDAAVDRALAGRSTMKVLLGDSSTGKSRAAWEAVRKLPEDWRLWHPNDQNELLSSAASVAPRTVLWLNEINRFLLAGDRQRDERAAKAIDELLGDPSRSPVLVMGTIWYVHWQTVTAAPSGELKHAKSLLAKNRVQVPEAFDDKELAALEGDPDRTDGRLLQAARLAESGHVIQYLAGGPAQMERYRTGSPTTRAVLEAAMDARRIGHGPDLPGAFLKEAAASYLTELQRDLTRPDWFRLALEYLSAPCKGVRGPLVPVSRSAPGHDYRLSDYLELQARRTRHLLCPGAEFWSAGVRHCTVEGKVELARAALDRGRTQAAEELALAAAEEGSGTGLVRYADWLAEHGREEDSLPYYELAADLGVPWAQVKIAARYEEEGRLHEAELWYRRAVDADRTPSALVGLASVLMERGDHEGATELYEEVLRGGFFAARSVEYQARWLAGRGQHELALRLTEAAFRAGDSEAFTGLAWTYRSGDTPRAIAVFRHALKVGDANAARELCWLYEEEGDPVLADRFCELALVCGETNVLRGLGMIRRRRDPVAAAGLFWQAYNLGLTYALFELGRMREEQGRLAEAERIYRRLLDTDRQYALDRLVHLLERTGRTRQAEELAGSAVDLLRTLAQARAARGAEAEAEQLLLKLATDGYPAALLELAAIRRGSGDLSGAEQALRQAQAAGVGHATNELVRLQEQRDAAPAPE